MRPSTLPPGISQRCFNTDQSAEYLGIHPATFRTLVKRGVVYPIEVGGIRRNLFDRFALDEMIGRPAVKVGTP